MNLTELTKLFNVSLHLKKIALEERRIREGNQALSSEELIAWIEAVNTDLNNHLLTLHDYTLFMLTLYLGDRKSETYALQWKYIDFEKQTVRLKHALDKYLKKEIYKRSKGYRNSSTRNCNGITKQMEISAS